MVGGGNKGVCCFVDTQEKRDGFRGCPPPGRYGGVGGTPSLGTVVVLLGDTEVGMDGG